MSPREFDSPALRRCKRARCPVANNAKRVYAALVPTTLATKIAPGFYEVTDGTGTVTVTRLDHLPSSGPRWVATADWDRHCYTDPVWTLADAKAAAATMLEGAPR